MDLRPFLEDLERRLDPGVEDDLRAQWRSFLDGDSHDGIFSPRRRRASPPGRAWPGVRVNAALDDPDAMLLQQLKACSDVLAKGGGAILNVRANYGTGILSSLFGAELFVMDDELDTLPTTAPLPGGAAAIRRLLERGRPDLRGGLGARTLDMGRRFVETFAPYPGIRRYVAVYHPDLQGPMDIVELVWGSSLFVDICDEPELVQAFLALVTETYTAFLKEWERIVPYAPPYSAHWGLRLRGELMLRDDSAMNFSPEMYDAFIRPWDAKLLENFDGGAIHFCGRGSHYIGSAATLPGLSAVNLSQPEHNDMETIFRHTVDRGIKLLGLRRDAAEAARTAGRDLHGCAHCW